MGEKILIICSVLDVTLNELLGGTDGIGSRSNPSEYILVATNSEYGRALMKFLNWRKEYRAEFKVFAGIVRDIERRRNNDYEL